MRLFPVKYGAELGKAAAIALKIELSEPDGRDQPAVIGLGCMRAAPIGEEALRIGICAMPCPVGLGNSGRSQALQPEGREVELVAVTFAVCKNRALSGSAAMKSSNSSGPTS